MAKVSMNNIIISLCKKIPILKHWAITRENIKIKIGRKQLLWYLKRDKSIYWPVHKNSFVGVPAKILIGPGDEPGNRVGGCYIQGSNGIIMGGYNFIGPNVGIITSNHFEDNIFKNMEGRPTLIGAYCWIGMNSVLLPEIQLGDHVIIAANSIVNESVPSYSVVAGNPARIVKKIDKKRVIRPRDANEYYGFINRNSAEGKEIQRRRIEKLLEYSNKYGKIISETLNREMSGNEMNQDFPEF